MQKQITVLGRTLGLSAKTPSTLTFNITPVDVFAARCTSAGKKVLIDRIDLTCNCSGDFVTGTSTFAGTGNASIIASTARVKCEGQSILTEGDNVKITCSGTVTTTASGATAAGTASVTVTIDNPGQLNTFANKI